MSGQLLIVEGVIGIGKTTLTEKLGASLGYLVMKEPVDENPYLEKFYADPERYGLEMQFWLMSRRFAMHQEAVEHIWRTGQGVIMDRSIYGDATFAKKNHLDGNIDEMGYQNYMNMRDAMFRYLLVPHAMIFLHAPIDVCLRRIESRNRSCEQKIPADYLQGLHSLYMELKIELKQRGAKVLNLDWTEFPDFSDVLEELKKVGIVKDRQFAEYPQISVDQSFLAQASAEAGYHSPRSIETH